MTDKPPAKPTSAKADKSEVTLLDLPGFKVSVANERYLSAPAKHDDPTAAWLMGSIIAAIVLGGLIVVVERVRQRKGTRPSSP